MKRSTIFQTASAALFAAAIIVSFTQCTGSGGGQVSASKAEIDSLKTQIAQLVAANESVAKTGTPTSAVPISSTWKTSPN